MPFLHITSKSELRTICSLQSPGTIRWILRSDVARTVVAQGIIINGCIRDSEDIGRMPLGVKALNTYPLKSSKRDNGLMNVPLTFAGVNVRPGDYIYADKDGVLVASKALTS